LNSFKMKPWWSIGAVELNPKGVAFSKLEKSTTFKVQSFKNEIMKKK
jgi:hypothetical protein